MRVQKWRRSARRAPPLPALLALALAAIGCALGAEEAPGCHDDAECGGGFVCRAGACFSAEEGSDAGADAAMK